MILDEGEAESLLQVTLSFPDPPFVQYQPRGS